MTAPTTRPGRDTPPSPGRDMPPTTAHAPDTPGTPDPRRWWALVVIALAQLMVILDATIVNIALPSAQRDLGMSDGSRLGVPPRP